MEKMRFLASGGKIAKKICFAFLTFVSAAVLLSPVFPRAVFSEEITTARRAELERQLAGLESQIEAQRKILDAKQRESVSLERDIAILNAKIKTAKLNIKARDIAIERLSDNIKTKAEVIGQLASKIEREKESLSQIIRKTSELDSYSFAEFALDNKTLSDFFTDADSFVFVKKALRESFEVIGENKARTEEEKQSLEDRKNEEVDLKKIQELEKRRVEEQEAEKSRILKISRGVETVYQKVLKSNEEDAAKIRAELFALRGSAAIPFGQAVDLAISAGNKTGVRPALILGIIAEESNLGENVGTGSWRVDMKAPRDTEPFQDITRRLGLNPDKMPVSKKPWYGYGGAMGPAQFIPSTWIIYENRIAQITGHNPPNPWNPEDAFTAAALLLKDSGAAKKTAASERYAALCYLAGCKNAKNKAYAFYGDDVMELAAKYQKDMDLIKR